VFQFPARLISVFIILGCADARVPRSTNAKQQGDSLVSRDSLASPDSLHWKTWQTETFTLRYPPNAALEDEDAPHEDPAAPPAQMVVGPSSHGPDEGDDYYVQLAVRKNRAQRPLREWVDRELLADDGSRARNAAKPDTVRVRDLIFIRNRSVRSGGGPMETFWVARPGLVVTFVCLVHKETAADEERNMAICRSIVASFRWRSRGASTPSSTSP